METILISLLGSGGVAAVVSLAATVVQLVRDRKRRHYPDGDLLISNRSSGKQIAISTGSLESVKDIREMEETLREVLSALEATEVQRKRKADDEG